MISQNPTVCELRLNFTTVIEFVYSIVERYFYQSRDYSSSDRCCCIEQLHSCKKLCHHHCSPVCCRNACFPRVCGAVVDPNTASGSTKEAARLDYNEAPTCTTGHQKPCLITITRALHVITSILSDHFHCRHTST